MKRGIILAGLTVFAASAARAEPPPEPTYTVTLTEQDVAVLLAGAGKLPLEQSIAAWSKLRSQVLEARAKSEAASKSAAEPPKAP